MSYKTSRPVALNDLPESWNRLPYHVAIIPVDPSETALIEDTGGSKGAPFKFDEIYRGADGDGSDILTQQLDAALSANSFRKVTVLSPPSPQMRDRLGDDLLPSYWIAAAREANADLLLDVESFEYPERPKSSAKLGSFLLYLFGPVELLYPDREYSFEGVHLAVSLYDLAALEPEFHSPGEIVAKLGDEDAFVQEQLDAARRFEFGEEAGTLREFRLTPRNLSYRFGDRLDKSPASPAFWPSLIIPSAWLQKDSPRFSERLTRDAALALAQDLARDIVEGDYQYIVRPNGVAKGLLFDARNATIARSEMVEGALEIRGRMRAPSSAIEEPRIIVAGRELDLELREGARSPSASDLRRALHAPESQRAVAVLAPIDPADGFDRSIVVYVPDPGQLVGVAPASTSEMIPTDVVQIRLGERLNALDSRTRSWTFDLHGVVDEGVLENLGAAEDPSTASPVISRAPAAPPADVAAVATRN